ncbi:MHC class II transactivator isoform X2 [Rhineura floridana]|uniref:MHC class II transactivator isoform X2 n=1 Tax=Rhineura floridana TaxID=261503 RepID=UPI002AC7F54D|nr:MHC class II transactivator isoform X2 [Rhineura floridana]
MLNFHFCQHELICSTEDNTMDPGILAGKSYLELLYGDVDLPVLYKQIAETDQPSDNIIDDQDNNPDVFYTVESDESGEKVCLCSDTGEAYDKIAALAEYLLKDQQEKPEEDLFGSLVSDETAAERPGGCTEAKKRRSCSDALEAKRRKVVHSPALCVINADSITIPLGCSPVSQSNFHVQFSVTTISPAGRPPKAFEPSETPNLGYCPLSMEDIQVILAFAPLAQHVDFPAGPDVADINTCPGEVEVDRRPETPPVHSEQADKLPDHAEAFCRRLKSHFRDACRFVPMEREVSLDHLYIESGMVQCPTESRNTGRSAELRPCDPREKGKATVERSQLFQLPWKNNSRTKIVLIFGKAGMGKSLLVQKICRDWSDGNLPEYDFIFRFDCRKLSLLLEDRYSLKHLLFELSDGFREGNDEVYKYILQCPEKALLVFDGFEELKDQDGFTACSDSPPYREPLGIGAILAAIFQKKVLNGCTLLLTARPKDKLHQYLSRMDAVLEVVGFSMQQAELFLTRYFEGSPCYGEAVDLIKNCPYLFSHCYNPDLCRFICETVCEMGDEELPSTLTSLFVKFLLQKLAHSAKKGAPQRHRNIAGLAQVAWSFGQNHQNALTSYQFPSTEVMEFALNYGLVVPFTFPENSSSGKQECGYVFSSFVVQNFLIALHLVLAKEIKDKILTKYLRLLTKSKKFLSSWDLVPRFLSGLLFLRESLSSSFHFGEEGDLDIEKMVTKKQKSLSKYIRKLKIRDFGPDKLLELLHCVHETGDQYLLKHLALEVRSDLSFLGFPLTPSNVYVLHSVLRRSTREFALDLRGSTINSEGLRQLVILKNVTSFRASLSDAVQLWRHLWEAQEGEQLQSAMEKFIVVPFKAKTMKDIDDLSALVHTQEQLSKSKVDSAGSNTRLIPAVTELRQLEFTLGPACSLKGLQKLVGLLVAFPALQHLDLDSPNENEIGDEGVTSLSSVLRQLTSLETLNLSRNKITDLGAEQLAKALPSLPSLKTLSLYNNSIGDAGAEHFAKILPEMASLRVLDIHCNKITAAGAQHLTNSLRKCPRIQSVALWNPTIPHRVLDYLRQLDSRIRLL